MAPKATEDGLPQYEFAEDSPRTCMLLDMSLRTSDRCHWCGNPFSFRRFSGGITSLEKEVAPKATEDGLPQSVFAGDFP